MSERTARDHWAKVHLAKTNPEEITGAAPAACFTTAAYALAHADAGAA